MPSGSCRPSMSIPPTCLWSRRRGGRAAVRPQTRFRRLKVAPRRTSSPPSRRRPSSACPGAPEPRELCGATSPPCASGWPTDRLCARVATCRAPRSGWFVSGAPMSASPAGVWLFIIDGAKALSKAIRRTFGKDTPIQRCQVHKARNITERLPKSLHASVRKTLRQAWEMDDAAKAEHLVRNLARRLETDWPGISATILEGLEEILCVVRLGLPQDLRRSLACTNIIENMNGTIRQVTRNVKRWRDASMALRWTAAGMMEARKGFRRLKAYKQLPKLRDALLALKAARATTLADHSNLANRGEAA